MYTDMVDISAQGSLCASACAVGTMADDSDSEEPSAIAIAMAKAMATTRGCVVNVPMQPSKKSCHAQ